MFVHETIRIMKLSHFQINNVCIFYRIAKNIVSDSTVDCGQAHCPTTPVLSD